MENNKGVTRFLVGLAGFILVYGIILSIIAREWSFFWLVLSIVVLGGVGIAAIALLFAIELGPLVWLLSRLANRKKKTTASSDEHPHHRGRG